MRLIATFTRTAVLGFGLLAVVPPAQAKSYDGSAQFYAHERAIFTEARKALGNGSFNRFRELQSQLGEYPIAHYLEYERLRRQIRTSPNAQELKSIFRFENQTGDKALAAKLRSALEGALAKEEKWSQYLSVVRDKRNDDCDTLLANIKVKGLKRFDDDSRALWAKPVSHSGHCKAAFAVLEKQDGVSVRLLWQRLRALMARGRTGDVNNLLGWLNARDRSAMAFWVRSYSKPEAHLPKSDVLAADNAVNRRVLLSLVQRWSKRNADTANRYWQQMRDHYSFNSEQRFETDALIARMAAFDRLDEAQDWLNALPDARLNNELREWRVRAAVFNQDWPGVIKAVLAMPADERAEDQWRYWLARAYEQQGQSSKARALYGPLSEEMSYHGFLAADRLGADYHLNFPAPASDAQTLAALAAEPALIRAREYALANLGWEGRREWSSVVEPLDNRGKLAAAELAYEWGWADRAVYTANRGGHSANGRLRFPLPFAALVKAEASRQAIDPAWIYGVMRRESAFIEDIRSGAGAVGLMQLMPSTARAVAKKEGRSNVDLTRAQDNIPLGSAYLRSVLNTFEHQALATAAYNAGPSRVKRWLDEDRSLPADVWVDAIPYTETRRYVRAVMAYTTIFEWQLNQRSKLTRLSQRMPEIRPDLLLSRRDGS
ncbi:transglycosylase SLT domain-containing protein [Granulosicoccaceae sp. 1_MG-2023]|nr:transglycosylase SLT domain-containing protein [Granulosicoccaceae sp. 1_MG-2023]